MKSGSSFMINYSKDTILLRAQPPLLQRLLCQINSTERHLIQNLAIPRDTLSSVHFFDRNRQFRALTRLLSKKFRNLRDIRIPIIEDENGRTHIVLCDEELPQHFTDYRRTFQIAPTQRWQSTREHISIMGASLFATWNIAKNQQIPQVTVCRFVETERWKSWKAREAYLAQIDKWVKAFGEREDIC